MPFGVEHTTSGHNFAIFSKHATAVTLLLYFNRQRKPDHEIFLDPKLNRTGDVWHILIQNLPGCFFYMYRMEGPQQLELGYIFDHRQLLLDPYVKFIAGLEDWGKRESEPNQLLGYFKTDCYDWGNDQEPNIPLSDTIIYEMHVRGFSQHPSSGVINSGTYRGIIEKIAYLKSLGITAIELMPVQEFDETDCRYVNPQTGAKLLNYWGYSTIGFFALKTAYSSAKESSGAGEEFKDMVKALHAENLEIILDVVFNHTAEGDRTCPVFSFKGIENSVYYILDETGDYRNYSGCGNTMNCNHPVVRKLIMDALRYWVVEMHVDGFRFDLAAILTRDEDGEVLTNPPLLEAIAKDPVLSSTKIIAEAWDAAGLYQVGSFPASKRWAEWNGRYRDTMRQFLQGEPGLTGEIATRISGSEDLYRHSDRNPYHSINFISAHDGFSMMDLVSYSAKHNQANGEENSDGCNHNFSHNFGVEGESTDKKIISNRKQQIRNMVTMLMLSQGTPMILAGDEFGNSQKGNNNAWCQDNEISWLNWDLVNQNQDLLVFWKKLIKFRKKHAALHRKRFYTGEINQTSGISDISWHNTRQGQPDFNTPSRSLAFLMDGVEASGKKGDIIYAAMNFSDISLDFEIPTVSSRKAWKQVLSTSAPKCFIDGTPHFLPLEQKSIQVAAFSITVLTN
jgi:isoamylase